MATVSAMHELRLDRFALSSLVSLLSLLPCGRAAAAELHWQAPHGCPDIAALEQKLDSLLGRPFRSVDCLDADGTIVELEAGGYRLQLDTRPKLVGVEPSHREIDASGCQQLLDAAAVAISLAVTGAEPMRAEERVTNSASDAKQRPGLPAGFDAERPMTPPAASSEPSATDARGDGHGTDVGRSAFSIAASALIDSATLGGPTFGVEAELAWQLGWLRLGAAAGLLSPRTEHVRTGASGVESRLDFAGPLLCARSRVARVQLHTCGELELGVVHVRGLGQFAPHTASTAWRALLARLSATWPADNLVALSAALGLSVPLTRPEVFVVADQTVFRVPAACLRVQLGVTVTF